MASEKFDPLAAVDPGRYNWRVKVRISRKWESIQKNTGNIKGCNIILVDDQNTRKHAFIGEAYLKKFDGSLEEGQVYIIQNFNVKPYTEKEKHMCFKDETHIYFSSYTQEFKYPYDDTLIPANVFGFYDISELNGIANQNTYLIDVVGVVQNVEPPRHFVNKNNEEQSYVKFDITDGSHCVKVTLWDGFGHTFYDDYTQFKEDPIILILSSCKANVWEKILSLSNYPATRYFFNYSHHSVNMLRASYKQPGFRTTQVEMNRFEPDPKMTVAEVKNTIPDMDEMKVVCTVTINKITNQEIWFYHICCGCSNEIEKIDGKFKCDHCQKIEPYPDTRFRVCTLASDHTGTIGIILYDREVRRVIGHSVFEIECMQIQEGTSGKFPPLLLTLEKLPCIITLSLKRSQSQKKTNIFHAADLTISPKLECPSPTSGGDTYIKEQASVSEGTVTQTSKQRGKNTPDTLRSTNKPKGKKKLVKKVRMVNLANDEDEDNEDIPLGMWNTQTDPE
ncbi:replication protein A 70 kDa DNA-binding subunit A-like [Daucus carota subsp. sativus]|uniref:replication protein A 70 kDa DNA-binding subunit A-like n=1 Tax=Daucus carota subsp. sativus TaxID=79200 RepID=UPI003082D713